MGGNVVIDGISADRICFRSNQIEDWSIDIRAFLWTLRGMFSFKCGKKLFECNINRYLSGSSYVALGGVYPSEEVIKYIPSLGDVDVQVDETCAEEFTKFIQGVRKVDVFSFIGLKRGNGQIVTLWVHITTGTRVQIDFEFVPFENGYPTNWATFSRYSDFSDIKLGVKGVFHKLLLRALTAKTLKQRWVLYGKNLQMVRNGLCTLDAFSVTRGLRRKLKSTSPCGIGEESTFEEIPVSESKFITDPAEIFEYFFEVAPSCDELSEFYSFQGTLKLIKKYYNDVEISRVKVGFCNTLWGSDAQLLDRHGFDFPLKMISVTVLEEVLGAVEDQSKEIESYYEKRRSAF